MEKGAWMVRIATGGTGDKTQVEQRSKMAFSTLMDLNTFDHISVVAH